MTGTRTHPVVGINMVGDTGWMGGRLYVRNLVMCLARLPVEARPRVVLLGNVGDDEIARELLEHDFVARSRQEHWRRMGKWPRRAASGVRALYQRLSSRDPWLAGIDVVYPQLEPSGRSDRDIFWIPDFQHRYLPQLFTPQERVRRDETFSTMAAAPSIVVLSSQTAARDFADFYPDSRASARILRFCSILTPAQGSDTWRRFGVPERYMYVPNQFWTHKNHAQLFRALGILKSHGVEIPLVCTGQMNDYRTPTHIQVLNELIDAGGLRSVIHLLGLIPRGEQIKLFRRACCIVQPSRFEGWSTVVEDAQALGRPILLSDIPVHREQVPDGRFFPLDDDEALATALADMWQNVEPGPDPEAEARATLEGVARQTACAREFMSIVTAARDIRP